MYSHIMVLSYFLFCMTYTKSVGFIEFLTGCCIAIIMMNFCYDINLRQKVITFYNVKIRSKFTRQILLGPVHIHSLCDCLCESPPCSKGS